MVIKTFNVEEQSYKKFADFCKEHGLSMSNQINVFIKAQIETQPKIREEYLRKLEAIRKGRFIKYSSVEDLRKEIERR